VTKLVKARIAKNEGRVVILTPTGKAAKLADARKFVKYNSKMKVRAWTVQIVVRNCSTFLSSRLKGRLHGYV
jgi:hypothetical protein